MNAAGEVAVGKGRAADTRVFSTYIITLLEEIRPHTALMYSINCYVLHHLTEKKQTMSRLTY